MRKVFAVNQSKQCCNLFFLHLSSHPSDLATSPDRYNFGMKAFLLLFEDFFKIYKWQVSSIKKCETSWSKNCWKPKRDQRKPISSRCTQNTQLLQRKTVRFWCNLLKMSTLKLNFWYESKQIQYIPCARLRYMQVKTRRRTSAWNFMSAAVLDACCSLDKWVN